MPIDIIFIIMFLFGFYFGYAFGLVRVAVYVVLLLLAIAAAMRFTPATEGLIRDIFETDSVYLPFLAFVVTLLAVLGIARLVSKLLESTINNARLNTLSRVFGGIIMSFTFLFLYSVLITFFAEAKVIKEDANGNVPSSYSYKYIKMIPDKGHVILENVAPFIKNFMDYMRHAVKAMERRNSDRKYVYNDSTNIPKYNAAYLDSINEIRAVDSAIVYPTDSNIVFSISTDSIPTIKAKKTE